MTDYNKLMRKSKLGQTYNHLAPPLREKILEAYVALLSENTLSGRESTHLKYSILPAVAFYRVLPENGMTKSETVQLIRKGILDSAQSMTRFFQMLSKLPFFFSLFRMLCRVSMKGNFGGESWCFEWQRNDPYVIEWTCLSCLYVNVLKRYGMKELAPLFCESDDVIYGNIPSARWGRTKTIGRGAELCDFRFFNVKKEGFQDEKHK